MHALREEGDSMVREHRSRGGGTGAGRDGNRRPFGICTEETLESLMRPAPEILGIRVKRVDTVGRQKDAAAGPPDAMQLTDRLGRVGHVLEHLEAQDDVEACSVDWDGI